MGEWMITMGLIGLYRVFQYGIDKGLIDRKYQHSLSIQQMGLEVDINLFPKLPRAYFLYLIEEYSVAKRECEKLNFYMRQTMKEEQFKNTLSVIKDVINNTGKKVLKYFANEEISNETSNILETLKQVKKYEDLDTLETCVSRFKVIVSEPKINEKLTLNYFKAAILKSFFGQVSFLNVSKNNLDLEGHIHEFEKDYIAPTLLDLQLEQLLTSTQSAEEVIKFLDENKGYQPFKILIRAWKSKSLKEIRFSMKSTVNKCMFLHKYPAFYNFEEMVFSPIGVAKNNALNFNWNLENHHPKPISSLAKLLLFFAPAGATIYLKKEGFDEQSEYRSYSAFVQTDATFPEILQKNNHLKQMKQQKEPFDRIVSRLVLSVKKEAEYVTDHLFFIEFSSDYDSKKTLLYYYHLPLYLANYFRQHGSKLDYIKPYEYREHFVQYVLRGADPSIVIYRYLRYCIERGHLHIGPYIAIRERNRIIQFKKGVKDMSSTDKRVYAIFRSGQEIRRAMELVNSVKSTEKYSASPSKKINSIAYRLLNAAKAGNQKSFMDTLFRLHVSAERAVSPIFLNALHERDLDFVTVANAFIAGLLSSELNEEQGELAQ